MDTEFKRHEPCRDRILLVLTLDKKKMKERILIGTEAEIRLRLSGHEETAGLLDETRPLGTLIIEFEHDEDHRWNEFGLMPLYNALHTNRWKQPELEQTASGFLSEQYASGDPVRMYAAFRIWNDYLITREVRARNPASEMFLKAESSLTLAFHTDSPLEYNEENGKPCRFDLTRRIWRQIPSAALHLDLWYQDRQITTECISIHDSLYPLLIYYINRLLDWELNFCKCKVCGKIFLAKSLRYELCSEKCRKAQALQNKRDFDARARKNNYDLLYKNETQNWRYKIKVAKANPDFPPERLDEMLAVFEAFKEEAKRRKHAVKEKKSSPKEFSDWILGQSNVIIRLARLD